jgi:hypothetical protein
MGSFDNTFVLGSSSVGGARTNDGRWHHVVATASTPDSSHASAALYVDGALKSSFAPGTILPALFGANVTVGYSSTLYCSPFGPASCSRHVLLGGIDEVAYYNQALTATQVATHFAAADLSVQGGPITAAERRGLIDLVQTSGRPVARVPLLGPLHRPARRPRHPRRPHARPRARRTSVARSSPRSPWPCSTPQRSMHHTRGTSHTRTARSERSSPDTNWSTRPVTRGDLGR